MTVKERFVGWARAAWKEWRQTIFLIVFVILPIKSSLADMNWVPTGSMNPTILEGDFLFVNKAAYDLRLPFTFQRLAKWADPARGDIVICFSPDDGTRLVKRIIGLPGDVLRMSHNQLYINGEPANQTGLAPEDLEQLGYELKGDGFIAMEVLGDCVHPVQESPYSYAIRSFASVKIPEGHYFVMGDNRDNSRDSRIFGFVKRKAVVGQAVGVIGSIDITDKFQPRISRFFSFLR